MKLKPELLFILLPFLFSCVYDPPLKGKEISIHNQTDKQIIIVDSLYGNHARLYDTAIVNGRRYIARLPNYMIEYGVYKKFYSDDEMNNLKNKKVNKMKLYIIDTSAVQNTFNQIHTNHLFRSFEINIDSLEKYDLNHLFITNDTILFEHDYSYYTNRNQ